MKTGIKGAFVIASLCAASAHADWHSADGSIHLKVEHFQTRSLDNIALILKLTADGSEETAYTHETTSSSPECPGETFQANFGRASVVVAPEWHPHGRGGSCDDVATYTGPDGAIVDLIGDANPVSKTN